MFQTVTRQCIALSFLIFFIIGCAPAADVPTINIQMIDEKPWWLDSLIQSAGIFITAWFVVWQIKKQRESAIKVEKVKFRNEINYQIYQKMSAEISAAQKYNYTILIRMPERIIASERKEEAIAAELSALEAEYNNSFGQVLKILSILEDYEITLNNLSIFKVVIFTMLDELMEQNFALRSYVDKSKAELLGAGVSSAIFNSLKSKSDGLHECWMNLSSYLFDLSVECQNQLLGDIFQTEVKPRKPRDPKYKAIRANPKEVVEFFKNNEIFMARWEEHIARYGEEET